MLSVEDIKSKQFTLAWRGYRQTEVDSFLERVEDSLASALSVPPKPQQSPDQKAGRVLSVAQETADKITAEARVEAARLVEAGGREAEQFLAQARADAQAVRAEAAEQQNAEISALEQVRRELEAKIYELQQAQQGYRDWIAVAVSRLQQVLPDEADEAVATE